MPPYRKWSRYLRERFGCRVHKIPLNAGMTCPTRDGTLYHSGCLFCDQFGSGTRTSPDSFSVEEQIRRGIDFGRKRYGAQAFLPYFQSFTNTYAPIGTLKLLYDLPWQFPEVCGMVVGTRPDNAPDEVLDLLASYGEKGEVWVEYGVQSIHDASLRRMLRGHGWAESEDAIRRSLDRGLKVCAHIILGLPGETPEMMVQTAETLSKTGLTAVKIHCLYISKTSPLEKQFRDGKVAVFSLDEYKPVLAGFLSHLAPEIIVQRLFGEPERTLHIAPDWVLDKAWALRELEGYLVEEGISQGRDACVSELASQ